MSSEPTITFLEALARAAAHISRIPELDRQRGDGLYDPRFTVPTPHRFEQGPRIIRVERSTKAHLVGNWYTDLIGSEFSVLMFDIAANEYTVYYNGEYRILCAEDVEILRG